MSSGRLVSCAGFTFTTLFSEIAADLVEFGTVLHGVCTPKYIPGEKYIEESPFEVPVD